MNSNNLYQAPESDVENIQNSKEELEKCLAIAKRQKALLYTFLAYFTLIALTSVIPGQFRAITSLLSFPLLLAIIVFTARLCWILYNKIVAVIMILLSIIPVINLLVFLFVNSKSNREIKSKGFTVGFMGVDTEEIANAIKIK